LIQINEHRVQRYHNCDHKKQWLDTYGVIKAFKNTIDENVTIPSGTNGVSAGTTKISPGYTVTVQGEWRIV